MDIIYEYILIGFGLLAVFLFALREERKIEENSYSISLEDIDYNSSQPSQTHNSMMDEYHERFKNNNPEEHAFQKQFFSGPIGEYRAYLKSRKWELFREYVFQLADFECQHCGTKITKSNGHCHHISYENVFHEHPEDCIALCRHCHIEEHKRLDALRAQHQYIESRPVSNLNNIKPLPDKDGF